MCCVWLCSFRSVHTWNTMTKSSLAVFIKGNFTFIPADRQYQSQPLSPVLARRAQAVSYINERIACRFSHDLSFFMLLQGQRFWCCKVDTGCSLAITVHIVHIAFLCSSTHTCMHSFIRLFVHLFIHPSIHPFVHSITHSFIHSLICSFTYSFMHLFIHSVTHSVIHAFTHKLSRPRSWYALTPSTLDAAVAECDAFSEFELNFWLYSDKASHSAADASSVVSESYCLLGATQYCRYLTLQEDTCLMNDWM